MTPLASRISYNTSPTVNSALKPTHFCGCFLTIFWPFFDSFFGLFLASGKNWKKLEKRLFSKTRLPEKRKKVQLIVSKTFFHRKYLIYRALRGFREKGKKSFATLLLPLSKEETPHPLHPPLKGVDGGVGVSSVQRILFMRLDFFPVNECKKETHPRKDGPLLAPRICLKLILIFI